MHDGGAFPAADFDVPVEFDQFLATFDSNTRRGLRRFIDNGGPALEEARPGLSQLAPQRAAA